MFSFGFGASMTTCCPLGRIRLGFPASVSALTFPMTTPRPVAIKEASCLSFGLSDASWMLVSASGSSSGLLGDELHSCCPSAAVPGIAAFATWEGATVGVGDLASPMTTVASGTTALTPGLLASARASAAGIVAATALRSESFVMRVAPTCLSWDTSGACIEAAVASRARRWLRFAGRLPSWSLNTTTTCCCLPDVRALTWLVLNLAKLGAATLARGVEPAAELAPIAVTPSAAAPSNEATLRGVKRILLPPFGTALPARHTHGGRQRTQPTPELNRATLHPQAQARATPSLESVPPVGLEPTTFGLKVRCSTN